METCALLAEASALPILPLSDILRSRGMPTLVLSDTSVEGASAVGDTLAWNPPSILSAHTVMLEAQTRHGGVSAAVFAFDAASFGASAPYSSPGDAHAVVERLITGWVLLAESVREHFLKRGNGRFLFLQCVPAPKQETVAPSLPLPVALAEAAFIRLAEETLARDRDGMRTSMIRYETGSETTALEWLADRVTDGHADRSQPRWVKAGSRGLFGLI